MCQEYFFKSHVLWVSNLTSGYLHRRNTNMQRCQQIKSLIFLTPLSAVPSNAQLYVKGVKGYTQMLPQGSTGPGVTKQNMVPSGKRQSDEQLAWLCCYAFSSLNKSYGSSLGKANLERCDPVFLLQGWSHASMGTAIVPSPTSIADIGTVSSVPLKPLFILITIFLTHNLPNRGAKPKSLSFTLHGN